MIGILQLTYTGCQHSNGLKVLKVGCMVMGSLINSEDEITSLEDREWLQYVQYMTVQRPEEHQITTTVTVQKKP